MDVLLQKFQKGRARRICRRGSGFCELCVRGDQQSDIFRRNRENRLDVSYNYMDGHHGLRNNFHAFL